MSEKKYVSLARLSDFLDNIKAKYSEIGHKHTLSDLSDYTVDTELSSTSTNPVQNKVIDAEFDAISDAMGALETAIDEHTHEITDVNGLQTALDSKANSSHGTHVTYSTTAPLMDGTASAGSASSVARSDHRHPTDTSRASQSDLDALEAVVEGKADASHTHTIANVTNLQTSLDAKVPTSRTVNGKALSSNITLSASDVGADASGSASAVQENLDTHTSNADIHFTATERTKLSGIEEGAQVNTVTGVKGSSETSYRTGNINITKANIGLGNVDNTADSVKSVNYATSAGSATKATQDASGNVITSVYETKTDASAKLDEAKAYADSAATTAANTVKNDLLNGAGTAYDTLKELGDLIDDNTDAIDALETVAAGKADAEHTHAISDVSGLQSALDGKAASSHGTHVSYSTTAPVMDGTASVGSASTVARSDHKHPTDTSRAAKTDLDSHTSNTTVHITSTERSNWNAAKTHADSAHAPSNAQPNQNAFSNVTVGSTTIAADTTTDTLTLVAGTNVTITPDATNDKITISATDTNTTYSAGTGISLSGTTFSNSGVRSIATGSSDGTISVNTNGASADVAVKGLGSAAYKATSAFDAAGAANTALTNAKTYTDEHSANTTKHITSTERTNWGAAYTHSQAAHAPSNAQPNQNAFSNIAVSGQTTVAADTTTDTVTFVGSNVSITTDATNDKVTFTVADGSTSAKGLVQLTNSTSSTSTTTAATPSSVKSAYDLANTAKTNAATAQTKADNAYTLADSKIDSLSDLGITATVTELNYVDGVTSNVQTQLNAKATSSHVHGNITNAGAIGTASGKAVVTTTNGVLTTGTIPVTSGGTGATTAAGALTNLGLTATAVELNIMDGVTATAAEINKLDGLTATTAELNYVDGVTSNIQTQLDGKAASSHGTHVTFSTTAPVVAGTASVGSATTVSRSDHIHPAQTSVSGNAGTATKLETARTISLTGDVTGSGSFDGSANLSIAATVADNSHNHSDYVSKSSAAVQPIMGGLVIGGSSATATGVGRIMLTGSGNPLIGLQAVDSKGTQLTPYYFQVANNIMYLGPTSGKALQFNSEGNMSTPGSLTVSGTITEGGTSLSNKYATKTHGHAISDVTDLDASLDAKQDTITGGASTIASSNLTVSRALVSDSSGKVAVSAVTSTELGYLDGVTSNIQTQLDGKMSSTNPTGTGYFSLNRLAGSVVGDCSFAEGYDTTASGNSSHAEGYDTTAFGHSSHAEGDGTTASGHRSHAEGYATVASGDNSHAEGYYTTASGNSSHAEGYATTASSDYSHAEGSGTDASGDNSHAEGLDTTASGIASHAEGDSTTASGDNSHAEGASTTASGNCSHAEGVSTTALDYQHAQGHYNDTSKATANTSSGTSTGTAFVIGNGTSTTASNAFRVTSMGQVIGKAAYSASGADYAEFFEWADQNLDNEDRVGYFVTFDNNRYIRKAKEGDYILGIVSGNPCVLGNHDECWLGQYEMDEWGRFIYEDVEEVDEETGETKKYSFYKVNPNYDKDKEYTHRQDRAEWDAIGLMGVLSVRDDGTCEVNGYCKCTDEGIATVAERSLDTYRVIERVNENIVKVVLK